MDWIQLVKALLPAVVAVVPGGAVVAPFVPLMIHAIGEAQQLPGASGAEKRAHVLAIVADSANVTNAAAGRTVVDPAAVVACAGLVTNMVVGAAKGAEAHAANT